MKKACFPFAGSVLLSIVFIILFCCSCKKNNDTSVIKSLERSLLNSNNSISVSNQQILASMTEKLYDPATKSVAERWAPFADRIKSYSEELFNYIESLKNKKKINSLESSDLFKRFKNYQNNLMAIDSLSMMGFPKIMSSAIDTTMTEGYFRQLFSNASMTGTKAVLTKFQNDILTNENRLILYCHEQAAYHPHIHVWNEPFVAQNSKVFQKGEVLEVTAGVGNFNSATNTEFIFNRTIAKADERGIVIYKTKVPNKPGNYSMPVVVSFLDQDGMKQSREFSVTYTVAKVCDQ